MKLLVELLRKAGWSIAAATLVGCLAGSITAMLLSRVGGSVSERTADVHAAAKFFALAGAGLAAEVIAQMIVIRVSSALLLQLRLELCRRVVNASLQRFEATGATKAMAVLMQDVPAIAGGAAGLPPAIVSFAIVVATLGYLTVASWRMMLLLAATSVLGVLIVGGLRGLANKHESRLRSEQERLIGHFQTMTAGIKELKLHSAKRRYFLDVALGGTIRSVRERFVGASQLDFVATATARALVFAVLGAVLFLGPVTGLSAAEHSAEFAVSICYLVGPVGFLMAYLPTLARVRAAAEEVDRFSTQLGIAHVEEQAGSAEIARWTTISLQDVCLEYGAAASGFRLGPVSLDLRAGKIYFIVGGNGSGKSTLIRILTGLMSPDSGQVAVDDEVVTSERRLAYQALFSAVFFDFSTFLDVRFLHTADMLLRAQSYLADLGLAERVRFENGQFITSGLSSGQKRRLALICSLLEDRPVYVFDEFASDQDPRYKAYFYTRLLPELKAAGKTVVVVSHDDRFFHLADALIKMEDGRVADEATGHFMTKLFSGARRA